ncbi:uncharacterized protein LOC132758891 isoform X2 [Ruditapes philippinarum]|uniref:uncharacterized protein LOC132758891 isoform X2 n=1 Tax=Ruditapes philippinarum TaxID=129788 RepID=UPI00295B1E0B|nr:uncharacterized protein LOC132758891 isoform X2 [Ruditapes philippinarum]
MPKRKPSNAIGGKRKASKASPSEETSEQRLASLIATAIVKDKTVLKEIMDILPNEESNEDVVQSRNLDGCRSFEAGTALRRSSHTNTNQHVTKKIAKVKQSLIDASLATSTHQSYERFWNRFNDFVMSLSSKFSPLPAVPEVIHDFIAHLHMLSYSPATISSHLSAISHFHQLSGFPDPCKNFTTQKMLLGCRKTNKKADTRLPILNSHIDLLLKAIHQLYVFNPYLKILYSAIILTTYHGFFRVGELLPATISSACKVVQIGDVCINNKAIRLKLLNHKTRKTDKPIMILIRKMSKNCPVQALHHYLKLRGKQSGALFQTACGSVVTQPSFREIFKSLLICANLSPASYKLHSFRIGACTQAIISGTPENEVMRMGRWKSHAFKRYIRVPMVTTRNTRSTSE